MRWIFSFLLFSSCIPNNSLETMAQSQQNSDNLVRLSSGMSAEEVMRIMHRPYRIETYQIGEDSYEAWFYITEPTALGQGKPTPKNLTPLILKDGTLMGRGHDYYRWLVRKQEDHKLQQKIESIPEEHGEDRSLEKSLNVTMSKAQPKQPEPEPTEDEPPLTPEDEDRLEQESEQNFDYW